MNNYFHKYHKSFSYLFLTAYLFFIALTIFHYHHVNIQNGDYKIERNSEGQTGNPIDKLLEVNGECIVFHFSSTIDNISYIPNLSPAIIDNKTYLTFQYQNKIPKQEFSYKKPLRAPPSNLT